MASLSSIKLPNNVTYTLKDSVSGYVPSETGTLDGAETVITNASGQLTSRKLVEGYTIVSTLPTTDIDENMIYLIPTEYDPSEGGGEGGTVVLYSISKSNGNIILSGTDGSSSSVPAGLTQTEVQALIDESITSALEVSY